MEAEKLQRGLSRQLSTGSLRRSGRLSFRRQSSFDPRLSNAARFIFGRQSSLDPHRRIPLPEELTVPENLDSTMQLLFMSCRGDARGLEDLLREGVDVNSIDLDGRTALHVAACEGHVDVVQVLLRWKANIDARDRWGGTAAADAKYYGNIEVYNILRARGAKIPKNKKTPMAVSNPQEIPEYELNPGELQLRRGDEIAKGTYQVAKWNGTKVAVKILDKESYSDPDSISDFKHELSLLQKIRHPNIVQFVGAVTQNFPLMIVLEYHPKGDLGSYLRKKGRLQMHKALRYSLDIARGMNYLHECKPEPIVHCDLRPKNILLDYGSQLKVAGFGSIKLSKCSSDKVKLAHHEAQIANLSMYVAPEVYKSELFDRRVDVFSFGLILYEVIDTIRKLLHVRDVSNDISSTNATMIEGIPAFHPKPPEEVVRMICLEGMRPLLKHKSKGYPLDLKDLIEECWDINPEVRPPFSEIIIRLHKMYSNYAKQGHWKDTFKLPWK